MLFDAIASTNVFLLSQCLLSWSRWIVIIVDMVNRPHPMIKVRNERRDGNGVLLNMISRTKRSERRDEETEWNMVFRGYIRANDNTSWALYWKENGQRGEENISWLIDIGRRGRNRLAPLVIRQRTTRVTLSFRWWLTKRLFDLLLRLSLSFSFSLSCPSALLFIWRWDRSHVSKVDFKQILHSAHGNRAKFL